MSYLPLDLKFLILDRLPPLYLLKLLKQLNLDWLNYHYQNLLAVPRVIKLPFVVKEGRLRELFASGAFGYTKFIDSCRIELDPNDFQQLESTKFADGDIIIITSTIYGFGQDYYYYFDQGTFYRLYDLGRHNLQFRGRLALPVQALFIFTKYNITTINDLAKLYPTNIIGLELAKQLVPPALIKWCNFGNDFGIVPIVLGYKDDKIFYINNHYLHIGGCVPISMRYDYDG